MTRRRTFRPAVCGLEDRISLSRYSFSRLVVAVHEVRRFAPVLIARGNLAGQQTIGSAVAQGAWGYQVTVQASGRLPGLGRVGLSATHAEVFYGAALPDYFVVAHGTGTLTTPRGSLWLTYDGAGEVEHGHGESLLTATITGGTGRFAGASGTLILTTDRDVATGGLTIRVGGGIRAVG